MNSYDYARLKEGVREILNEFSGDAWSDGADFEHSHDERNVFDGAVRFLNDTIEYWNGSAWFDLLEPLIALLPFGNLRLEDGVLQYYNGTDWVDWHTVAPTSADGNKLWLDNS